MEEVKEIIKYENDFEEMLSKITKKNKRNGVVNEELKWRNNRIS